MKVTRMRLVETVHNDIGYTNNVEIIEAALREHFGFNDNSHVLKAVAAHIWSAICPGSGPALKWGTPEVVMALAQVQERINRMMAELQCKVKGCAISYPHWYDEIPVTHKTGTLPVS